MSVQPAESMREVWASWQGQVLHGTFPLHRCLGSTDHSGVFLTELTLRRSAQVAIKVVPAIPKLADSQLQQWTAAALLDHPHLVRILETGRCQFDGAPYLYVVMEYADQNLAELLPKRALTEAEAREMLVPALDALAFLHNRNLVQGQLKPANLLAVGDQLRLASDTIHRVSEAGVANVGSAYDPPEARDGSCSTASDVWALGVTLFEALTQHVPSVLDERRGGLVFPPEFPAAFREMVAACLSRRPYDRPKVAELEGWARRGGEGWRRGAGEGSQPPTAVQSLGASVPSVNGGEVAAVSDALPAPDLEVPDLAPTEVVAPASGPIELEDISTEVPVLDSSDEDSSVPDPATFELAEPPPSGAPAVGIDDVVVTHPDAFALVDTPAPQPAEPSASAPRVSQAPRSVAPQPAGPEAVPPGAHAAEVTVPQGSTSRGSQARQRVAPQVVAHSAPAAEPTGSSASAPRVLQAPQAVTPEGGAPTTVKDSHSTAPNASALHASQVARPVTPDVLMPRQPRTAEAGAPNTSASRVAQVPQPVAPQGVTGRQASESASPGASVSRVSHGPQRVVPQMPQGMASQAIAPRAPVAELMAPNAPGSRVSQVPQRGAPQASTPRVSASESVASNSSVPRVAQAHQASAPQGHQPIAPQGFRAGAAQAHQSVAPQVPRAGVPQAHQSVASLAITPRGLQGQPVDSQAAVSRRAQTPETVVSRARVVETVAPPKAHGSAKGPETEIEAEFSAPPHDDLASVDEEAHPEEPVRKGAFLTMTLSAIVVVALALMGARAFMTHRDVTPRLSQGLRGATVPDTSELTDSADAAAPTVATVGETNAAPVGEGAAPVAGRAAASVAGRSAASEGEHGVAPVGVRAAASGAVALASGEAQFERRPAQAIPTSTRTSAPSGRALAPSASVPVAAASATAMSAAATSQASNNTQPDQSGIHQEFPDVPPRARRSIRGHVRVSVRVIVDKEGAVFAALVDNPGPSKYFARLALEAAKKWTFPPAAAQAEDAQERRWEEVRFDFTRDGTTGRADPVQ